jgi:hypothetical protein
MSGTRPALNLGGVWLNAAKTMPFSEFMTSGTAVLKQIGGFEVDIVPDP